MSKQLYSLLIVSLLSLGATSAFWTEDDEVPLRTNFTGYDMSQKYKYLGCFDAGRYFTELPNTLLDANMSTARCYMYCMDSGHQFFGTQERVCNCGDTYGKVGQLPEARCNRSCGLEPAEKCGGDSALSVYAVIEKFLYVGCFSAQYRNSADWKPAGQHATKMDCSLRCQKELSPFFGMLNGRECVCVFNIDRFVQQSNWKCHGLCLEVDIMDCGVGDKMSVYNIEYAIAVESVLGSRMGFLGESREFLLTVKSATLFGVMVDRQSKLFISAHYENASNSGNYVNLIGETPAATPAPCPVGWLNFSIRGNSGDESSPSVKKVRQGYRCYLPVLQAQNWTNAVQKCWSHEADLFYLEDDSEYGFLANASIRTGKYWVGMYFTTLGVYAWLKETAGNQSTMPVLGVSDSGCVRLTAGSLPVADACALKKPFLCKRFSSLYSSWDAQLPTGIPFGRRVALKLYETSVAAPILQLTLNLTYGSHVAAIDSHAGSRLRYSVTERVPMKICHPGPPTGPAQYNWCSQPGNASPKHQFGKYTCANKRRLHRGAQWMEPLGDWVEDVTYHVAEVRFLNRQMLNESSLTLTTDAGTQCRRVGSSDPAWVKFACDASVKGLLLASTSTKYPYIYMCDLQVQGYLVRDNCEQFHPENPF